MPTYKLEAAIAEAIVRYLEDLPDYDTQLINDLDELSKGGAIGRAGSDAQQLWHYAKTLAHDAIVCNTQALENAAANPHLRPQSMKDVMM